MRLLCILFALSLAAQADQVTLKNGDRITGAVVKKDAKSLTLASPVLGTVTMPWDQVESLKAETPVNVVLSSGQTVKTTLETAAGQAQLAEPRQTVPVGNITLMRNAAEQAAYERMLRPGWGQLWTGSATVGFAGTSGNAKTQTFTVAANAARVTSTDKSTIYFNTVKASALVGRVNQGTAQAIRGGIGYNHNIANRLFVNTAADFEYDLFQNLDLRYVMGGGLGYQLWKTETRSLSVVGGAAYDRAKFAPPSRPEFVRQSASAYWGDDFSWRISQNSSLVQNFRMFNNISRSEDYRANFDITSSTKIARWLTWNVGISMKYLNLPAPGRKTNDVLYTTGLGIIFSR